MDTGQVWVWDIEREARVRWLQVADGFVESLTFSPDGRLLMAGATDGKVTIWPTDEGLANAAVIDVGREAGNSVVAAFRDEGRHIVTIPNQGPPQIWDRTPDALLERARDITRRDLTQEEWDAVLPDRPYGALLTLSWVGERVVKGARRCCP